MAKRLLCLPSDQNRKWLVQKISNVKYNLLLANEENDTYRHKSSKANSLIENVL